MSIYEAEVVDFFAGPGGWDEGMKMLGITDVIGIELEPNACATAEAAGHRRLQADIAKLETVFRCIGAVFSPPCQAWSLAGKRKGELDRASCHVLADRMAGGDDSTDWTEWEDERSPLVCQPVRWVRELRPEWFALEEVPQVATLWEHFARIFRAWGYSVWTGDVCAADYGVPQTRTRRILIASRVRTIGPPPPTHSELAHGSDLLGGKTLPWLSMADALGWGMHPRPCVTLISGGKRQGGADPLDGGSGARETLRRERREGRWAEKRPATTVVGSFRPDVIAAPGHRTKTSRQNAPGLFHVTVQEAGILQSFPCDYPWQGTKSKQYEQVGNAIPPLLAAHIIAAATGIEFPKERAA